MAEDCVICDLPDQAVVYNAPTKSFKTTCDRCGEFALPAGNWPGHAGHQVRMSGYVREQNAAGITPLFTEELIQLVESIPFPRMVDRSRRLLAAIVRSWGLNNNLYSISNDIELQAVAYCADDEQLGVLFRLLDSEGLVEMSDRYAARITPKGFVEAEQLNLPRTASAQGFVAMSFDAAMTDSYVYGFSVGIGKAGYKPLRIDGKDHVNSISDEILAEIRRSRFVVADYTLMNNGVYFEAGFAIGLGITVIPTCRSDYLGKLHFDVRHINTLEWDEPGQLAQKLAARISAVIGDGPLRAPSH